MSVDCFFFLKDERLPSCDEWQRALNDAGIGIVLDVVEDLRTHTGFLPAKFNGHDSGFEWFYGTIGDIFGEPPDDAGDRAHAVDFVTHSDLRELVCALYAGGTLAKLSDGLFYDEETETFVDGDRVIEIAARIEEQDL